MEDKGEKSRLYREKKTEELIKKFQGLIDKVFEVIDKDLLEKELEKAKDEESEKKYLDKISARRKALEEVEIILDKIEALESKHLRNNNNEPIPKAPESSHPAKRHARRE